MRDGPRGSRRVAALPPPPRPAAESPTPRPVERTLLIVDDEPLERRLVAHALAGRHRVLEAHDPASALDVLERGEVDLVLLDLHLPPHDASPREGIRLCGRIRELQPAAAVVVISANGDAEVRAQLLRMGARAFLVKPVDARRLVGVVRDLLDR